MSAKSGELDMSNVGRKPVPVSGSAPRKVVLDASILLNPLAKTTPRVKSEIRLQIHAQRMEEDYTDMLSAEAKAELAARQSRKAFAKKGGAE